MAFTDLRDDPIGVTRGIDEQFGLDWTPEAQAAIEEVDRESTSGHAAPRHSYSLEDYGLTERQVLAAFDH